MLDPELIETLPAADDATFHRDSKKLLQRFDEYITAAEAESENLSIELDDTLAQQELLTGQLRLLNKPNTWHERHLLLKLDRLKVHGDNLQKRIEIYCQNMRVYLNLISKVEEMKAMRMNGLDETKIETIWLEFKDTLDEYKQRVGAEESGFVKEPVLSHNQEKRLQDLKREIFPEKVVEAPAPAIAKIEAKRKDLDTILTERQKTHEENFDDVDEDDIELE